MKEDQDDYEQLYKIIIIGDSGVGKSNILGRYLHDEFKEDTKSTVGVEFGSKKMQIENATIKLQIWDTAGQEKYRALAKIFYQNASAAILVYDITTTTSFQAIKEYWADEIKSNSPEDIVIAVVANKSDEYLRQNVPTEEGKELAKQLNAIFANTSAKIGDGIDALFQTIAEKFVDPSKDISESYMNKEELKQKKIIVLMQEAKNATTEEKNKNTNTNAKTNNKGKNEKKKCC
jgi:small GTP-binding protein